MTTVGDLVEDCLGHMDQGDLADELGVSQQTISRWLNGDVPRVVVAHARLLALHQALAIDDEEDGASE